MQGFDFDELFLKFRYPLLILLVGGILIVGGVLFFKSGFGTGTKVEVLNNNAGPDIRQDIAVEISGEVLTPGVYKLPAGSRVDDLLVRADGFSADADRTWTNKYLNRAAKLTDGQKVYVPGISNQSSGASASLGWGDQTISSTFSSDNINLININTASSQDLDSLPGIGPTYAQNIIEHRPYSTTNEVVSKGAIKQSLYDKIKDKITIY